MKVLLRISRFPVFPAKKKSALLIAPKCVSANKWEVLHIRVRKCMCRPVIYEIDYRQMAADGYHFFESANHVWLTKEVPARYLKKL